MASEAASTSRLVKLGEPNSDRSEYTDGIRLRCLRLFQVR